MKKIILFSSLFIFFIIGWDWTQAEDAKAFDPQKRTATLIPMSGYTTLRIQYKNSTTVHQFKLPSEPDLVIDRIKNVSDGVPKGTDMHYLDIEFSFYSTTQFVMQIKNWKVYDMAIITSNKVLTCVPVRFFILNSNRHLQWHGTKKESDHFMENLYNTPLQCYCIPKP